MLLGVFGPHEILFIHMCYNHSHGNAVEGFLALLGNIYDYVRLLLLCFRVIIGG
jgi:hypothetical protein